MYKTLVPFLLIIKLLITAVYFYSHFINFYFFVIFYLVFSLIIAGVLKKGKVDKFWIYSIVIIEFTLPIYGALAIVLGMIINRFFDRSDDSKVETSANFYLDDYEQILVNKKLRLKIGDKIEGINEIRPYLDILRTKNTDLKVDICIKLSRNRDFASIKLLKVALTDTDYEVRYMANNALGMIEKEFLVELEKLTNLINKFPTEMGNHIKRAEIYLDMNQCGILDESLCEFFLSKARSDLQVVLLNQAFNPFLYIKLAYIYNELGEYKNLVTLTEKAILFDVPANEKNKLIFFAVEGYFKLRNFKRVEELINTINLGDVKYGKISETVLFWRKLYAN